MSLSDFRRGLNCDYSTYCVRLRRTVSRCPMNAFIVLMMTLFGGIFSVFLNRVLLNKTRLASALTSQKSAVDAVCYVAGMAGAIGALFGVWLFSSEISIVHGIYGAIAGSLFLVAVVGFFWAIGLVARFAGLILRRVMALADRVCKDSKDNKQHH